MLLRNKQMGLIEKDNDYKVEDFEKELPNGAVVFDYHKIYDSEFPITLVVSERGGHGKTFNSIDLSFDKFEETDGNFKVLFMRNTVAEIQGERDKFLDDAAKNIPDKIADAKMSGNPKDNSLRLLKRGQNFIKFLGLNVAEKTKGAREIYDLIIWDEFNVSHKQVTNPMNKLDTLLHSAEDVVNNKYKKNNTKLFIHGNNKSLNHPFITSLGISSINKEVTTYYHPNGMPLVLIIWPMYDEDAINKIKAEQNNNWIFQLSEITGFAEHSYYNETLEDEINFVYEYSSDPRGYTDKNFLSKALNPMLTIKHKGQYYNVFRINPGYRTSLETTWHVAMVEKEDVVTAENGDKFLMYLTPADISEETLKAPKDLKDNFRKMIGESKISFEDIMSRDLFISSIRY